MTSAGHAGSQQPAAGSSIIKQSVAAACSSKRGGDWCSRWRELGEDVPGCASHAWSGQRACKHPSPPSPPPRGTPVVPSELTYEGPGSRNAS